MDAIIIIGAPGVGKGSFCDSARELSARIHHISTGDLIRGDKERQRQKIEDGQSSSQSSSLISASITDNKNGTTLDEDEYINDLLVKRIESIAADCEEEGKSNSILFLDGYPRRKSQCEFLDKNKSLLNIIQIVLLEVDHEKILVDRLGKRGRSDDSREMILRRLKDYREISSKVLDYYGESRMVRVKTDQLSTKEVYENIAKQLEEKGINL